MDARHGAVGAVGDPHVAQTELDTARLASRPERVARSMLLVRRVDPGQRGVEVVDHPDVAVADREVVRPRPTVWIACRTTFAVLGFDLRHRLAVNVGHPHRALADRDATEGRRRPPRSCSPRSLRVDARDGVVAPVRDPDPSIVDRDVRRPSPTGCRSGCGLGVVDPEYGVLARADSRPRASHGPRRPRSAAPRPRRLAGTLSAAGSMTSTPFAPELATKTLAPADGDAFGWP